MSQFGYNNCYCPTCRVQNCVSTSQNQLCSFCNGYHAVGCQTNCCLYTVKGDPGEKGQKGEKGESVKGDNGDKGDKGDGITSPLTTQGDIFVYSTMDTRQPVGPDGSLLRANTATTTGLDYTGNISPTSGNTFLGQGSGVNLTIGTGNTGFGTNALANLTTGTDNTAVGNGAAQATVNGFRNVAIGTNSLQNNVLGGENVAIGARALQNNTSDGNVAIGPFTLEANSGVNNIAIGRNSLNNNTSGINNNAVGVDTLLSNVTGLYNQAFGMGALNSNTNGDSNQAFGMQALGEVTTGNSNIGIGTFSGVGSSTMRGAGGDLTTENNNIVIGPIGVITGLDNRTYIDNIFGITPTDSMTATAVYIDANYNLGTIVSSIQFKENVKSLVNDKNILDKILLLNPVSFNYKSDPTQSIQYGLIAEEVNEIIPQIVIKKNDDNQIPKPFTVKYDQLVPLLLAQVVEMKSEIDNLTKIINRLTKNNNS